MAIPEMFLTILSRNADWQAKTQMAISRIEKYLSDSELYFFPEYTDHRLAHITNILEITVKLIPSEILDKLTPKDISFLILGTYCHDIGMFLKPDGLENLLCIDEWKNKFTEFIKIASRLSSIELAKIYGNSQAFVYPTDLKDRLNLTTRDRLTYGEFIRRNHAPIAEYVATNGFPGHKTTDLFPEFGEEEQKIIGLIAKSHGMSLRSAAEESSRKLIGKLNSYRPSDTPIIYLMALLRIGDILDMGKDRSPHIVSDMQQFNSAISKEEWEWNQTIDSSNFSWETPRTLYIQAQPTTTSQFVKVKKNLQWFQSELDFAWAALCDYYGSDFSLRIHRIESNIFEQPELFKNKFLTKEAKIKVAGNLSKLLVEPLYHGNPMYAVRELLQNSVDACKLRKKIEHDKCNTEYLGHIRVEIDTQNNIFTICDNGIGMDEDVITNYYLTIGASFQDSDFWKKASLDNNGLVRAGRFGVGFLATFLLGERITVTTRHIDDAQGYKFSVTLEDESISAERVSGVDIGTKIEVYMSQRAVELWRSEKEMFTLSKLAPLWTEWYHCTDPSVEYCLDGKIIKPELDFSTPYGSRKNEWFYLESDAFEKVAYGFFTGSFYNEKVFLGEENLISNVIVNGFLIKKERFKQPWGLPGDAVICTIDDSKNRLQLDLSRTTIKYDDEIFEKINIEIWKWQLAEILCYDISPVRKRKETGKRQKLAAYDKCNYSDGILYRHEAFSFLHPYFIKKLYIDEIYMLKEPLSQLDKNVAIQFHITNSDIPMLIYDGNSFKSHFEETYGKLNVKFEHLFELVDLQGFVPPADNAFAKLIDEIFSDAPDLWIPYDLDERRRKFPKAFKILTEYSEDGLSSLKHRQYRPTKDQFSHSYHSLIRYIRSKDLYS